MLTNEWPLGPGASGSRRFVATLLLFASRRLARWGRRVRHLRRPGPRLAPVLEFYAEAGAPEGALYVDGRLVGHLPGVKRL
jgi:hypothetical protein